MDAKAGIGKEHPAKSIFRVTSGNFLEMYDFLVYGFYAASVAQALFPSGNEYAALMLALGTYAAGNFMRPLGAIVLGSYIDTHGRRKGLLVTLGIMAAGMVLLTFTPNYASIGIWAPILALTGRLLQGFSAGAELGGVSVYLSEIAPPGRKGFFVSWQSASQQVAVVLASLLGLGLRYYLTPEQMVSWGWRIPFLIGCLIIPAIFLIRRSLKETEEFERRKVRVTFGDVMRSLGANWRKIGGSIMLVTLVAIMFNLITAYTPTYGITVLHLPATASYGVAIMVGVVNFIMVPLSGAVSDRIGRRAVMSFSATFILLTAYPAMYWLTLAPSFERLMLVEVWFAMLYGTYQGGLIVALTEIMPANIRSTGFSIVYAIAQAVFGGCTPLVCTWLVHMTDNRAIPAAWLSMGALIALVATFRMFRPDQPVVVARRVEA